MSTFPRPLHLLLLGKAPANDEIDGGFGEGGRDDFTMVPALRVVRDRGGIVLDVGGVIAESVQNRTLMVSSI